MLKELHDSLLVASSKLQFTKAETMFFIILSAGMLGLSIMFCKTLLGHMLISMTDNKIVADAHVKKILISENENPYSIKRADRKNHSYPFNLSIQLQVDTQKIIAYPIGKDKMFEYLSDAVKFAEEISNNAPIQMEYRTSDYIDLNRDKNVFYSLEKKYGETKTTQIAYCKRHTDHNSMTKVKVFWFPIIFTFIFGAVLLLALFLANNYSQTQKMIFMVATIALSILAFTQYNRLGKWLADNTVKNNPVKLSIDVDQNYNPDEAFRKITEFVKSRPEDNE